MFLRRLARLCAAGAAVALLAGCDGPSITPAAGDPAPQATRSGPSPATEPQLKKIVVQAADLPPGWRAAPYTPVLDEADVNSAYVRCLGIRDTTPEKVAQAVSNQYSRGTAQVVSVATSYRSQSALDEDFGGLHNPKLSPCFEQLLRAAAAALGAADDRVRSVSAKFVPPPAESPANLAGSIAGTFTIVLTGQPTVCYYNAALISGPLVEVEIEIFSVGAPVSQQLLSSLIAKVARRAANP